MTEMLLCKRCKEHKSLSSFYIRTENGRPKQPCKACIAARRKAYRQSKASEIAERNRKWAKANAAHLRAQHRKYRETPEGAWSQFLSHKKEGKHGLRIGKDAFIRWYSEQDKRCHYCGLTADEANQLLGYLTANTRRYRLQVDRLDSQLGYEDGNLALACKVCNEHKKDVFTEEQFLSIAENYLGEILLLRLRFEGEQSVAGDA